MTTLGNLVETTNWSDARSALLRLFPDAETNLKASQRVFRELQEMVPRPSDMRISVETTFGEGLDDEPFDEVVGRDGTLNRDLDDFRHGETSDSPLAAQEVRFSLALQPWDEWLDMSIDPDTLQRCTAAQVIAHCLWEMTFHGVTQAEVTEWCEELNRRVTELDAMSEEEKDQTLLPAEQVLAELEGKLERPSADDSGTAEVPDDSACSDYVGVATVHGLIEEAQLCSFLQGNGIPTRVRGEALRKTHGITVDGIGAAQVEVPAQFAQAARELIAMADRGELELAEGAEEDAI